MSLIADLHIHSPYSRATSPESDLMGLAGWASLKGIHLVGTGDFTHPAWMAHLKENLQPAEPGLFRLRGSQREALPGVQVRGPEPRFLLSGEISSIYKRGGRVRKVHNLVFASSLAEAERFNQRLASLGNIQSDGRPILGLDSRDLLEIQLETMPGGFLVPAHIWTPWFSLFGSKSGFDSVEECFGDLSSHVFALETGLSSDPAMNRLISALDGYTLISNSDCHSPSKLGREATLFDCELSFEAIKTALRKPSQGYVGTLEFYPDEGKYHLDGHRDCGVRLSPNETKVLGERCPVCKKPVTVGVLNRVQELADRTEPLYPAGQTHFESLIPLPEILSELLGMGVASQAVQREYGKLISTYGNEFEILRAVDLGAVQQHYSPLLAESLRRMRTGQVIRQGGFDGEFGRIYTFLPEELEQEQIERNRLAGRKGKITKDRR